MYCKLQWSQNETYGDNHIPAFSFQNHVQYVHNFNNAWMENMQMNSKKKTDFHKGELPAENVKFTTVRLDLSHKTSKSPDRRCLTLVSSVCFFLFMRPLVWAVITPPSEQLSNNGAASVLLICWTQRDRPERCAEELADWIRWYFHIIALILTTNN